MTGAMRYAPEGCLCIHQRGHLESELFGGKTILQDNLFINNDCPIHGNEQRRKRTWALALLMMAHREAQPWWRRFSIKWISNRVGPP